jgi:membrane dipeptidase
VTPEPLESARFDAARALHADAGLIDLHVDMVIQRQLFGYDMSAEHAPGRYGKPRYNHVDVPRMQQAAYGGACLGIHWWPWQSERGWAAALRQLDVVDALCEQDERTHRVRSPADWDAARRRGTLALMPGVEGAHMLNGRVERVDVLAERDVAYLTLAHFSKNDAATPSMGRGANERDGLTAFGEAVVRRAQDVGVVVDVAHVNTPGALDACRIADRPLLCTHTGAKGVHPSARNIHDEVIDAIARVDGTIGIIFSPHFLAGTKRAGTEALVRHARYIADRVGARHVALGSDYDGWLPAIFSDHRDCRDTLRVTAALLEDGFSASEVQGMLRGNALRVFEAAGHPR